MSLTAGERSQTEEAANDAASLGSPSSGDTLRRVLLARVLPTVVARLRETEQPLQDAAADALRRGLADGPAPGDAADSASMPSWSGPERAYEAGHRLLALTVSAPLSDAISGLARAAFGGDARAAAGWLLARGTGLRLALPSAEQPKPVVRLRPTPRRDEAILSPDAFGAVGRTPEAFGQADPYAASARALTPLRRGAARTEKGPRSRATPQEAVDAPTGDALRATRETLGLSQRDVAAAAGLSRGLVAEVERGRRANALTRLRIAETLRALQRLH